MVVGLQCIAGMDHEPRRPTRSLRSINSGQLVTPTDRLLVFGGLRKFDDQRRLPTAPAPDLERTELVRRPVAGSRGVVFAALAAIVGAAFEIARRITVGRQVTRERVRWC